MYNYTDFRTTNEHGLRWYHTPAGPFPSITTVLGGSQSPEMMARLENWKQSLGAEKAAEKSKQATDHGTMVHLMAERFLKGEDPYELVDGLPIPEQDTAAFNSLKLKLKLIEPWAQEKTLYSDVLGVAGRFDCVGLFRGVPSIIDFKTSLTKLKSKADIGDYELQLAFYAHAHNEMFDTQIDHGVILLAGAGGMPQEFRMSVLHKIPELKERIECFWERFLRQLNTEN